MLSVYIENGAVLLKFQPKSLFVLFSKSSPNIFLKFCMVIGTVSKQKWNYLTVRENHCYCNQNGEALPNIIFTLFLIFKWFLKVLQYWETKISRNSSIDYLENTPVGLKSRLIHPNLCQSICSFILRIHSMVFFETNLSPLACWPCSRNKL